MKPRLGHLVACLGILLVGCGTWEGLARAEIAQRGNLRVNFDGGLTPRGLPLRARVPISVSIGGKISTLDHSAPPPLHRLELAVNRQGHFDPGALPVCGLSQIQPATTGAALAVCGSAKVGEGSFSASVAIPDQSPFPSQGTVTAFNGRVNGQPAILLHVYGPRPIPISFTVPLRLKKKRGEFGTAIVGALPSVSSNVGFVTGLQLKLIGSRGRHGRHYLSAACPAPEGFSATLFPMARAAFIFAGDIAMRSTLIRTCKPIR
jgi:hypothetical protein